MAFLSAAILLPSLSSCLALRSFSQPPPSVVLHQSQLRHTIHSTKKLSPLLRCQPRASLSGRDPQPSDSEDFFQKGKEFHREEDEEGPEDSPADTTSNDDDPSLISSAVSSGPSSPTTGSPLNNVAALQFEKDNRQQEELRATLDTLSRSLELLSFTLSEISTAVRVLSSALGNSQLQVPFSFSPSTGERYSSPTELRDAREAEARERSSDPPEPWENSYVAKGIEASGATVDAENRTSEEDTIPSYLVEQNERAHKLAYRLQQAFIQARIEGLGKPFQVAAEDFVQACMEAHGLGIGLKELQLQLVLQDGSLTGAFAIRNQRWSSDPILNEASRVRSLWVRLVYAVLAQLGPSYSDEGEEDPIDAFVKQVLQMTFENGYDLERLKLEQAFAGPDTASGAVKTMRENQYIILLTLEKAKSQNT
ncbi:unnamed protein product [Calypogeia fissa]